MSGFRRHLEESLQNPEFKDEWEAQAAERQVLGAFMVVRNRELSGLDRLLRKPVLQNPFDGGLSSIRRIYDKRILLSIENLRRHVASLRAWRSSPIGKRRTPQRAPKLEHTWDPTY